MPELPEVETIMRGISPFLEGATIKKIKLYQASSSELFGFSKTPAQSETTPFYPKSPYATSKLAACHTLALKQTYPIASEPYRLRISITNNSSESKLVKPYAVMTDREPDHPNKDIHLSEHTALHSFL